MWAQAQPKFKVEFLGRWSWDHRWAHRDCSSLMTWIYEIESVYLNYDNIMCLCLYNLDTWCFSLVPSHITLGLKSPGLINKRAGIEISFDLGYAVLGLACPVYLHGPKYFFNWSEASCWIDKKKKKDVCSRGVHGMGQLSPIWPRPLWLGLDQLRKAQSLACPK